MTEARHRDCDFCKEPFEKNNYYYGKCMTVRDARAEQDFFERKRRLLNQAIHGWGVVYGLDVEVRGRCVIVKPGLALDPCGREILVCREREIPLDEIYKECEYRERILCIEFHDCLTEEVIYRATGCDDEDRREHNRIREGWKLCWHDPEGFPDYCDEERRPCCPQDNRSLTVHKFLCGKLTKYQPRPEVCCIPLARIRIDRRHDDAAPQGQTDQAQARPEGGACNSENIVVDTCCIRPFVYSNHLLYKLIHCYHGDLPHLTKVNWEHGGTINWASFQDLIAQRPTFTFDRRLNAKTLNACSAILTAYFEESRTGYLIPRRIPLNPESPVEYRETDSGSDAVLNIDDHFRKDEIDSDRSDLYSAASSSYRTGVKLEFTLRGGLILGENGRALDGEPIAFPSKPSGNGSEGGDFISCLTIRNC